MLIDICANFSHNRYNGKSIEKCLEDAYCCNVSKIILNTTNFESYNKHIKMVQQNAGKLNVPELSTSIGVHPSSVKGFNEAQFETLFSQQNFIHSMDNNEVVAIGEIGLDYNRNSKNKEEQINCFKYFLDKALLHEDKSLILHERDALLDMTNILKNYEGNNIKIIHCFTGDRNSLKEYLNLDCYIGVTGWITDDRRNHDLLESIKYIPLNRLLVETDTPFLKPRTISKQVKDNEPMYLREITKYIAARLSYKLDILEEKIKENTNMAFNFKNEKLNNIDSIKGARI